VVSFATEPELAVVMDDVDFWVVADVASAGVVSGCGAEESFWHAAKRMLAPVKTVKIFFFILCSLIISNPANRGQT